MKKTIAVLKAEPLPFPLCAALIKSNGTTRKFNYFYIAACLTAMLLLSGCGNTSNNEFSETAQTTLSAETTASEITEAAKTAISETKPEVQSITEISEPEEETDPKNVVRTIDLKAILGDRTGRFGGIEFFRSNTICMLCYDDETVYVSTIDIESGEEEIIFSDSFNSRSCYSHTISNGRLYVGFDNDRSLETLNVLINKDGSYETEISEYGKGYWDYDVNMPVSVGEHLVKSTFDGVFDAESGEAIIPAKLSEKGNKTETYELACVLDDNRFVYQKTKLYWDGTFYEGEADGIGIYNFETKTAEEIPDALEWFFAAANGKIYTESVGAHNCLSMTDTNTLETRELLGADPNAEIQTYFRITAPDNCEFIGAQANYKDRNRSYKGSEYILIDPENGEIIRTLPEEFVHSSAVNTVFYTENYICCRNTFKGDMLYIVER